MSDAYGESKYGFAALAPLWLAGAVDRRSLPQPPRRRRPTPRPVGRRRSVASVLEVLRHERRARAFLAAHAQSSIGTGAAAVALVVLAYDRFHSPWAITLVLL